AEDASGAARLDGPATPSIPIGSVDDSYADRLRPGDRLLLSGRCLVYRRHEAGALLVDEASTRPLVPQSTGCTGAPTREPADRLFLFRAQAGEVLCDGRDTLRRWLHSDYGIGAEASAELADYFLSQETVSEIPDVRTLLVEAVADDLGTTY